MGLPVSAERGPMVGYCHDTKPGMAPPAFVACGDGADFIGWFSGTNVGDEWHQYVSTIPLGHIYEVVDEARRRAAVWTSFASVVESRTR
jgi:hypothetical protein